MSKFTLSKVIKLDRFGKQWEGAYLTFTAPTWAESLAANKVASPEEQVAQITKFLNDHFVEGKAPGDTELIELKVTDIPDLPAEVIVAVAQELGGGKLDPNT